MEISSQVSDVITCGTFCPNGDLILLGLSHGQCMVYELGIEENKLTLVSQITCKNSRGSKRMGRKVTGFDFLDNHNVIISTNDSRMRLYNLKDTSIKQKYKGLTNEKFPIKSTFSHNLMNVISGSENGNVYIWNTYCTWAPKINPFFSRKKNFKNYSYEFFPLTNNKSNTIAIFAPEKVLKEVQSKYRLSRSDKIITHIIITICEGKLKVLYNNFETKKW